MVMSINNLKIFIEVAKNKSITKTADMMFISQPAISKAIKNIEAELNVKLFYRDKRNGLKLTDVGERILVLSKQMINTEEKIYQAAFRENNFLGGKLKIGAVPIATTHIIVKAMEIFHKKYPYVTIELYEGSTNEVKDMVKNYAVDLGISISPFEDLQYQVLIQDYMVAISKKELANPIIDFRQVKDKLYICNAGIEAVQPILEKQNCMNYQLFEVTQSSNTVVAMAQSDLGIGIISKLVLGDKDKGLNIYSVSPKILMDYALISTDFSDLTPIAKEFVSIIHQILGNDNN